MARLKSSFYVSWSKIQIQTASIALCKANVNPQWINGMWFTNRTGKNGKTFWVIVFEYNDFSITFICIDIIIILIIFSVVVVCPYLDSTVFVLECFFSFLVILYGLDSLRRIYSQFSFSVREKYTNEKILLMSNTLHREASVSSD